MATVARRAVLWLSFAIGFGCGSDGSSASDGGTSGSESGTSGPTSSSDAGGSDTGLACEPGEIRCNAAFDGIETCADNGREWELAPCDAYQECRGGQCVGPCELAQDLPSSAGCSFFANAMLHRLPDDPDAMVVGNPNDEIATLQLYYTPVGKRVEEAVGDPVMLMPGNTEVFYMDMRSLGSAPTWFRTGGTYRVESDFPIVAYQHSPLEARASNDSSMLLPESALRGDYVVLSYPPFEDDTHPWGNGFPSYFTIIGTEDGTTVEWTPPVDTEGDGPVPYVMAGETGSQKVNRFDTLRIAAARIDGQPAIEQDVSGTVIRADKPIWVVGAVSCAYVPHIDGGFCDHLQELLFPLNYWGRQYVGAAAVVRGDVDQYWRVFAGSDDVTISTEPVQPGTPLTLAKRGDYQDVVLPKGTSVVFSGDKAFMPVQYIASDSMQRSPPAMYQTVPVAQFLDSYAFVTGVTYEENYVQIIRAAGAADVIVDTDVVTGYDPVGDFEVANVLIGQGEHTATSDDPFGIIQFGFSSKDDEGDWEGSYAYPGGLKVDVIYTP